MHSNIEESGVIWNIGRIGTGLIITYLLFLPSNIPNNSDAAKPEDDQELIHYCGEATYQPKYHLCCQDILHSIKEGIVCCKSKTYFPGEGEVCE